MIAPVTLDVDRWLPDIVRSLVDAAHPAAIWLFGSRARGDHRPDSDVDLLVQIPTVINPRVHIGVLMACLGRIPVPVDIVVTDANRFALRRSLPGTIEHEAAHHGRRLV